MSENSETLADVLADMRAQSKTEKLSATRIRQPNTDDVDWALANAYDEDAKYLALTADRIEAAAKRECGNAAAMREAAESALSVVRGIIDGTLSRRNQSVFDCRDKLKAALAAPTRNCDKGTPEEQQDRFREFCRHYESEGECGIGRSEAACPAFQGGRNPDCSLWWAQMPYEKGGAK